MREVGFTELIDVGEMAEPVRLSKLSVNRSHLW